MAITLDMTSDSKALLPLLQPGLNNPWTHVHSLQVRHPSDYLLAADLVQACMPQLLTYLANKRSCMCLCIPHMQLFTQYSRGQMYLGLAFPELRSLHAISPSPYQQSCTQDGGLFCGIQGCSNLRSLRLDDYLMSTTAIQPSAAVLARLPSLKEVHLQSSTPLGLLDKLTGLTRLSLYGYDQPWMAAVTKQTDLQSLAMIPGNFAAEYPEARGGLQASALEQLLTACTSITSLDIRTYTLDQQGLDVLLAHGDNITTLKVQAIQATQSRTHAKWRVSKLALVSSNISALAHLPLRTVQELQSGSTTGTLQLQLHGPASEATLRSAVTNLAACPTWQAGQLSGIDLAERDESWVQGSIASPQQLIQLFDTLAPLAAPHLKSFNLQLRGTASAGSLLMGQVVVQALGRSLGQHLETLVLHGVFASREFRPALSGALPQLCSLQFGGDADGAAPCTSQDLTVYCCSRPGSRPLAVRIPQFWYSAWNCAELMESFTAQGLTHVTISACGA
jgi:hypothetical protein